MTPELRTRIAALGAEITPEMVRGTQAIFAELCPPPDTATIVTRDLAYGPDERHRLDLFARADAKGAPVLVYVPGGGFVMANHRVPGSPFYDNIGQFAAGHGMIGVTMTYRVAPAHPWPAGTDDVLAAVQWLRAHVAEHGGDPARIYLMGQSAGASHVASCVAQRDPGVAGAILVSCIYDPASKPPNPFDTAYYGDDPATRTTASAQAALIAGTTPLLCTISEFDMPDFLAQAAGFVGAWGAARGSYPRMLWLQGHNHLSPAPAIGGAADVLGPEILTFIAATSGD